ncbi:hypothetical protein BGY98DRAFT_952758 [Russula aff. rugulosa BPL654]|nr:hypothetical protein BGY98DRAFT_952758 [Russula aff. rugulosa BPL654]
MPHYLVEGPDICHTHAHDLESFFWVLIWIVLRRVKTTWDIEKHSSFINGTMSLRVCGTSGGDSKRAWLTSKSVDNLEIPGNETLTELVLVFKESVAGRCQEKWAQVTNGGTTPNYLEDHETMLAQINGLLECAWLSDDGAIALPILEPN